MTVNVMELRSRHLIYVVLCIISGLVLALFAQYLGFLSLPGVFFLLFILPWLVKDPFRLYLWLIITWPFLALYVRLPLPAGLPDISYDRVMVMILFGVVFLDGFVLKRRQFKFGWLAFFIGIYFAAQLSTRVHVILFGGPGDPDLAGLLSAVIIPIGMYWITKNVLASRQHLIWLLRALIFVSLLICFSGLIDRAIGGGEKNIFAPPAELGFSADSFEKYGDVPGGRAAGVMGNPGIYGAILGIGILASLSYFPLTPKKWGQILLLASILFLLIGVFFTYTRQAWLVVALVLFLAQFFISDLWKKVLPLAALILVFIWGSLAGSSLLESRVLNPENVNARIGLAELATELINEKPILGWGSGAMAAIGVQRLGLSSHNTFLSMLVDGGLVLFLAFLIVLAYLSLRIFQAYRITKRNDLERNVLVAMSGFVLIFLMSGMARELRFFEYFNAIFWICMGVIDRLADGFVDSGESSENNIVSRKSFQEMVNGDR